MCETNIYGMNEEYLINKKFNLSFCHWISLYQPCFFAMWEKYENDVGFGIHINSFSSSNNYTKFSSRITMTNVLIFLTQPLQKNL